MRRAGPRRHHDRMDITTGTHPSIGAADGPARAAAAAAGPAPPPQPGVGIDAAAAAGAGVAGTPRPRQPPDATCVPSLRPRPGLANVAKWNITVLVAALAADVVCTDARRLLRSRYLLAGALIAAALAAPDVIWQAAHGWPGLDVFRVLQSAAGHNRAVYWPAQVLYTGMVLTPLWVAGAVCSLRTAAARRFRPAAIACVAVIVLQFVLGGNAYYPGAAFTC